jgi:hypothetical protein
MDVYELKHYQISECPNCGALFICRTKYPKYGLDDLDRQYKEHLDNTPECKRWHDSLPTLMDIRGILK